MNHCILHHPHLISRVPPIMGETRGPSVGPRKKIPMTCPLSLGSQRSATDPVPTDCTEAQAPPARTRMMNISMDTLTAARMLKMTSRKNEVR